MRNQRRIRGVASTVFVAMILLAATTAAALTVLFATELHRTRDGRIHAQQRQLLIVGAVEAQRAAAKFAGGHEDHIVKLPASLAGRASLTVRLSNDEPTAPNEGITIGINVAIKATVDGQTMRQKLVLLQAKDQTWKIASVSLEGLQ